MVQRDKIVIAAGLAVVILLGGWVKTYSQKEKPKSFIVQAPPISEIYPELENWDGLVKHYKPAYFRRLDSRLYSRPDIMTWVSKLEPLNEPQEDAPHTKVWFKDNEVKYFYLQPDSSRSGTFYAVGPDSIEYVRIFAGEVSLSVTESGVMRWVYVYKNNKLVKIDYYTLDINFEGEIRYDKLLAYDKVEYWEDGTTPRYIYRYGYPLKLDAGWHSRTDFKPDGGYLRTSHPKNNEDK